MVAYGSSLSLACRPGWENAYLNFPLLRQLLQLLRARQLRAWQLCARQLCAW